jgi:hypothetical protein
LFAENPRQAGSSSFAIDEEAGWLPRNARP